MKSRSQAFFVLGLIVMLGFVSASFTSVRGNDVAARQEKLNGGYYLPKESNSLLEQMQDSDPALKFDQNPLPSIERDVRASIQDEKQHQLLFGTSDDAFVRTLLVSQLEASNYGHNLAKVLSEQESDPKRIKLLEGISAKWLAIHSEAFRLLSTVQ